MAAANLPPPRPLLPLPRQLSDSICAAHCSSSTVFAVALGISCGKAISDADEACSNAENSLSNVEDAVRACEGAFPQRKRSTAPGKGGGKGEGED